MLTSIRRASGAIVLVCLVLVAGCARRAPPSRAPSVAAPVEHEEDAPRLVRALDAEEHAPETVPKVIRRLLAEQNDVVARSQAMANELPDPRGRARAIAEVNELAQELVRIAEPMARSTTDAGAIESDVLDAVVRQLLLLDTSLSLIHEKLRTATERTTAALVE